jgi:H/ACA ribonucleoprotein complex subunit 4
LEGSGPGSAAAPVAEKTSQSDVLAAPPVAPNGGDAEAMDLDETAAAAPTTNGEKKEKRKSKHDGETPEERAERKRRKKEKKEKKEKRKSGASKAEDSDESD